MRTPFLLAVLTVASFAFAQEPNDMIELLRTDLRNERVPIIQAALDLTDQEQAAFMPVFEAFTAELRIQWDDRLRLVDEYTKAREEGLSDDQASRFLDRLFTIERKDLELRQKYAQKMNKVLPATKTARWLQLERRLGQLMELQVANEVIQIPARR